MLSLARLDLSSVKLQVVFVKEEVKYIKAVWATQVGDQPVWLPYAKATDEKEKVVYYHFMIDKRHVTEETWHSWMAAPKRALQLWLDSHKVAPADRPDFGYARHHSGSDFERLTVATRHRVQASAALLPLSGQHGVFVREDLEEERRKFCVVWRPNLSLAQAREVVAAA